MTGVDNGHTGKLVEDPAEVAGNFSDLLGRVGLTSANRLGLRLNVDRAPTRQELQAVQADRKEIRLNLVDTQRSAP